MKRLLPFIFLFIIGVIIGVSLPDSDTAKMKLYQCKFKREHTIVAYKQSMIDALWMRYWAYKEGSQSAVQKHWNTYKQTQDEMNEFKEHVCN